MPRVQPGPRKRRPAERRDPPPGTWQGQLRVWITIDGRSALGPGKFRLLAAIGRTKSLSAAAKELRMSYRLAWQRLRVIEQRTGLTVVEPRRGGHRGGGTELTPEGKALLKAYEGFRTEVTEHMRAAFGRHFAPWSEPSPGKENKSDLSRQTTASGGENP